MYIVHHTQYIVHQLRRDKATGVLSPLRKSTQSTDSETNYLQETMGGKGKGDDKLGNVLER